MRAFLCVVRMQRERLWDRNAAKSSVLVMLAVVTVAFIESCACFYGADVGAIPSASYGWVGNVDDMQIQTMRVLYYFLIFLLACSAFGDNFFIDMKNGVAHLIVSRCGLRSYLASTGALAFGGGFIVVALPLLLSQVLAFTVFPAIAPSNSFQGTLNDPAYYSSSALNAADNALFPSLYFNHPYLNNLLFIGYASLWAGIMSLLSFAVSLYVRKSRLVVLGVPSAVYFGLFFLLPRAIALPYYLYPCTFVPNLSLVYFFVAPLVMLFVTLSAIAIAVNGKREVLL